MERILKRPNLRSTTGTRSGDSQMAFLSSRQALQLAADFAFTAEYIRETNAEFRAQANFYEMASRAAFLKAHMIARDEEMHPSFGESFRRAVYAVA
jgi:hypothetical protein